MAIQGYYTTTDQRASAAAVRRNRIVIKQALLNDRLARMATPQAKHDDISNPYDFDDSERYDHS